MTTTRKPDPYDEFRARAREAGQPLRIRDLVAVWAGTNEDQLIHAAVASLREPPGTKILISPLSVVAFTTAEGRDQYYSSLFEEVRKTTKGPATPRKVLLLHTQKFIAWCRTELEEQFAQIVDLELAYNKETIDQAVVTQEE